MAAEKKLAFHLYAPEDLSKEWFVYYYDGTKRIKVKGGINRFKTAEERHAAAQRIIAELEESVVVSSGLGPKMSEWIEERRSSWRKKSYQTYKSKVDCFIEWKGRKKDSRETIGEFFSFLRENKHKTTHNTYLVAFKRILKDLELNHLIEGIEPLRAVSNPAKYFQSHQIERIKKIVKERDPQLWLACQFIYYCFIRPGELRMLKIGDIYFEENKILIRGSISKNKKQQFVTIPRPFRPQVEHLKYRAPNEYIFFSRNSMKPLSVNNLLNRFRSILTDCGYGHEYKLYSWKHTGAVACVRAGASLKELQIQLRHHSLEEVDKYIRQLGVNDLQDLEVRFPSI